jgi:hypothetical protein
VIGRSTTAMVLAAALAAAPSSGCAFAVEHPAIAAGLAGGTLGLGTCKLASDNLGACLAVGGGAGAFLGLAAAVALWLGGDGHTAPTDDTALPLQDDGPPRLRRHHVEPAAEPAAAPPADAPIAPPAPAALPTPAPAPPDPVAPTAPPAPVPTPASPTP